jgi:hypothetical protein
VRERRVQRRNNSTDHVYDPVPATGEVEGSFKEEGGEAREMRHLVDVINSTTLTTYLAMSHYFPKKNERVNPSKFVRKQITELE